MIKSPPAFRRVVHCEDEKDERSRTTHKQRKKTHGGLDSARDGSGCADAGRFGGGRHGSRRLDGTLGITSSSHPATSLSTLEGSRSVFASQSGAITAMGGDGGEVRRRRRRKTYKR